MKRGSEVGWVAKPSISKPPKLGFRKASTQPT